MIKFGRPRRLRTRSWLGRLVRLTGSWVEGRAGRITITGSGASQPAAWRFARRVGNVDAAYAAAGAVRLARIGPKPQSLKLVTEST